VADPHNTEGDEEGVQQVIGIQKSVERNSSKQEIGGIWCQIFIFDISSNCLRIPVQIGHPFHVIPAKTAVTTGCLQLAFRPRREQTLAHEYNLTPGITLVILST